MNQTIQMIFPGVLVLSASAVFALQDGLCRTPPMGWNSWNFYHCQLSEQVVLSQAQAMVKKHAANWEGLQISLKDAGYRYITMDDCWQGTRDTQGNPQPDGTQFPHGLKWLADSIHAFGLKSGIYSDAGTTTCGGRFGSYNYETTDANAYAGWGIDYLKHDGCNIPSGSSIPALFAKMSHALRNSGRNIVFSISCSSTCSATPWLWCDTVSHLWRVAGDITASWTSITGIVDLCVTNQLYKYAKPGSWNDADMLEVGNGSFTAAENQSHFDLWCHQASPLIMGNDLTTMNESVFSILSNREVIAVDQDSLGIQGRRVSQANNVDVWVKKMKSADTVQNRTFAVLFFNRNASAAAGSMNWADIGETQSTATYIVRDLWQHKDVDSAKTAGYSVSGIPAHGSVHLLLTRKQTVGAWSRSAENLDILSSKFAGRIGAQGLEVFIPSVNRQVRIFDLNGRVIASISAAGPAWYKVPGETRRTSGMYLVSTVTSAGLINKNIVAVR
jgi:alpha-galactosidase